MMNNPEELSPIWRKLPIELVHGVLIHFIDDLLSFPKSGIPILAGPVKSIEEGKVRAVDLKSYANGLLCLWRKWRHDSLFTHHRGRIERHFRDVWLNAMTFYLHTEQDLDQTQFCRYLPFACEGRVNTVVLHLYHPPTTTTIGLSSDPDSDSDWATFCLYGPIYETAHHLNERATPFDIYHTDPDLPEAAVEAWALVTECCELQRLEIGLRPPPRTGSEALPYTPDNDVMILKMDEVKLPGLQVLNEGLRIRFKWKELVDGYLGTFAERMEEQVEDGWSSWWVHRAP